MSYERQIPQTPITVVDTPSVDLTASGAFNTTLQADVIISANAGNTLSVLANGLYANPDVLTTLTYDPLTGQLNYTDETGVVTAISLPLENFLANAVYDPLTQDLTLTLTNGTVFTIDLTTLVDVTVTASGIQGNGTAGLPVKENFDALPAATAVLPPTVQFVMANDGTSPDGSIASVAQVVAAIITNICTQPVVAWDPTLAHYLFQANCNLTSIPAAPASCAAAPFGDIYLDSTGVWSKPRFRLNWQSPAITVDTTVSLANYDAFMVNAAAGNVTITVPAPTGCDNTDIYIKRMDNTANTVTVVWTPLADGIPSFLLFPNNIWGGIRGEAVHASWNGVEWLIV